jgi:microcystin-dependent protein
MRYYSSSATEQALTGSITDVQTSLVVGATTGFPLQVPYTLRLDPDVGNEELVTVTAVAGTTLTVLRGVDGSTAQAHTAGAKVRHGYSARDFREPQEHIEATSGVHGVGSGSSVVGTDTTQTLRNKTLDGDSNTFLDVPQSAIVDLPADLDALTAADAAESAARVAGDGVAAPVGSITAYAGASAPSGWLLADGTAVSRATYAALFAVCGTTYGAGNGSTTFNLPNLKGRVVVGLDASQAEFDARGETGGAKTVTLTEAQMPSHTHVQNAHSHTVTDPGHTHGQNVSANTGGTASRTDYVNDNAGQVFPQGIVTDTATTGLSVNSATATNQSAGGGGAHNNLQPYLTLNYIIRAA